MKIRAGFVLGVVALVFSASACTWGQYGAGPARTSSNPFDGGITVANAPTTSLRSRTANSLVGEPALTTGSVFASSGGFLYSYPADAAGCTGSPPSCTPTWFAHVAGGVLSSPVVDGDRVFVVWPDVSGQWVLGAYDARGRGDCTGPVGCRPMWTATLGPTPNPTSTVPRVAAAGGRVYALTGGTLVSDPGTVSVFDEAGVTGCTGTPVTCQPEFRTSTTVSASGWPAVADGHLYVDAVDHSAILAFDAAGLSACTGGVCAPQFRFSTGSAANVSVSGSTAFAAVGQQLRAFDATGAAGCGGVPEVCVPVWTGTLPAASSTDPPTVAGGFVFVAVEGNPGSVVAFDAAGATACSGLPRVCAPLWTAQGSNGNSDVHVSAAKDVLVTSWRDADPNLGFAVGVDVFDLAGNAGCTGVPKMCSPLAHVALGSLESISSPALAAGRIAVIAGFSGTLVVLGPTG